MKRTKKGSTIKQYAYATRRLNGDGKSKKEIALKSGYSLTMAENAKHKIEDTEGYKNAIIQLANDSNNLLMAVMAEFQARGLSEFSNKDLNGALNAISAAWDRIEKSRAPDRLKTPEGNPLRALMMKRVETQVAVVESVPTEAPASASEPEPTPAEFRVKQDEDEEDPMDF
jgi:hypothetical protein